MNREEFVRAIVPRGLTLMEHLTAPGLAFRKDNAAIAVGRKRLEEWRMNLTQFDPAGLSNRLSWAGMQATDAELAWRLRPVSLTGLQFPRQRWARQVWWLCRQLQKASPDVIESSIGVGDPVPFEDLFTGLAVREESHLARRMPHWTLGFSPAARSVLARGLITTLSQCLAPTLEHEYSLFRARHTRPATETWSPKERNLYDMFLNQLRAGEIYAFMVKYAAAARMALHAVRQWRRYHTELSRRLAKDRGRLSVFLGCSPTTVTAERVQTGLSDRHENGRTVTRLELESGHTVFYKPRSVELEAAIRGLISGVDASYGEFLPEVLPGDHYGWVSAVIPGTPKLDDYYNAAGRLIALSWLFAGTDLHDRNVIMGAESPIVVDGEMFASPLPEAFGAASHITSHQVEYATVLGSGLLPRWLSYNDGNLIQISGLAGGRYFATGLHTYEWHNVNTNAMRTRLQEIDVTVANADQVQPHEPHEPQDYLEPLLEGFRQACSRLKVHGVKHLADRAQTMLEGKPVRFLFRDTVTYEVLLQRLRLPAVSLTTLDTEIAIEALLAPLVADTAQPQFLALFQGEKEALLRGDIPRFLVNASSSSWRDSTGCDWSIFSCSGLEMISRNLKALECGEDRFQESLIRAVFWAMPGNSHSEATEPDPHTSIAPGVVGRANDPLMLAQRISSQLLKTAVCTGPRNDITWIAPQWQGVGQHLSVTALGSAFYDGRAGVGVFLAAMAAVTGDSSAREGAKAVFDSFTVSGFGRHWTEDLDNLRGGCVGRPSVIYALRLAGTLLNAPSYHQAARRLCAAIRSEDIRLNRCADWVGGVSGEAVALWPMRDSLPLDWQNTVHDRLVGLSQQTQQGGIFWPFADAPGGQTGASHGAAGITHALGRLFPHSKIAQELRRGAGIYLADHWHATAANWIPARTAENLAHNFLDGWAHGAPGILCMAQDLVPPAQAEAALRRLSSATLHPWDTLTAGNCAVIDLWITRNEISLARARTEAMLTRAHGAGGLAIPGGQFLAPGMFDGLAGIGYTLLRLTEPRLLPSVLRLEDTL